MYKKINRYENFIKFYFGTLLFRINILSLELIFINWRNKNSQMKLDKENVEKIAYKNLKQEYELLNKKCVEPRIIANEKAKGNKINFARIFHVPELRS